MIPADLQDRLRQAVASLGGRLSAAKRLGVDPNTVKWWMTGRCAPRSKMAEKLAEAVGSVPEAFRR